MRNLKQAIDASAGSNVTEGTCECGARIARYGLNPRWFHLGHASHPGKSIKPKS